MKATTKWPRRKNPKTGRTEIQTPAGEWVSRQRIWQIQNLMKGVCLNCGGEPTTYATRCDECARKHRERTQKARGGSRWKPGHPGRPPKTFPPPAGM